MKNSKQYLVATIIAGMAFIGGTQVDVKDASFSDGNLANGEILELTYSAKMERGEPLYSVTAGNSTYIWRYHEIERFATSSIDSVPFDPSDDDVTRQTKDQIRSIVLEEGMEGFMQNFPAIEEAEANDLIISNQ